MFRKLFCLLSGLVLVSLSAPGAAAQDAAAPSGAAGPATALGELIQQLGDPSYEARERAEAELASQGLAAEAALLEALKEEDVEIRLRASRILDRVREDAFESHLAAFIADVDGSRKLSLPGWERFRNLVEDHADTRKMFADMTRAERALLSAYDKRVPEMPALFAARVAWLQSQTAGGNPDARAIPQPSLATLLFIGSDHSQGVSQLYSLLCQPAAMQSIETHTQASVMRTLLERCAASSESSFGMMLAQKYDLKETGLQQATKLLEQGTTSSSTLHHAIINVGRFGDAEHMRLLTPLLDNKTVCHRWSNQALKKDGTINVEVRDAALVVLLHLAGKDPKQYGFKLLKENPETLYYVYTFGFVDDDEREAVHAKWAAQFKTAEE